MAGVCAERRLPLHVFPWNPEMRRSGLMGALADPKVGPERLGEYFVKRELRPSAP